MYISRHLESQVLEASKYYPVVMVCGQRQVGKSTMLNHICQESRRYVTLDDGNARRLATTDPALFFETYVVTEIVKSYFHSGKQGDFCYYRDTDKKEIDFLIVREDKIYPIEIKKAKEPVKPDKNFQVLKKLNLQIQPGVILCMSDELIPYNRETWYCPISVLF